MHSAFRDLFYLLLEVYPASKDIVSHILVSLLCAKNQVFKAYIDNWKYFKLDYFLANNLSSLARE